VLVHDQQCRDVLADPGLAVADRLKPTRRGHPALYKAVVESLRTASD